MCAVCGCGTARVGQAQEAHTHDHEGVEHSHAHAHAPHIHVHEPAPHDAPALDFGAGLAGVSLPGLSQERTIRIERDILSKNDAFAEANRTRLIDAGTFALNLVSSPAPARHPCLCARSPI